MSIHILTLFNSFFVCYKANKTTNRILSRISTRIIAPRASFVRKIQEKYCLNERAYFAFTARQKCAFVQMIAKWNVRRCDISPNVLNNEL